MKSEISIAHTHLETPLILSDKHVQVLVIENPTEFYSIVSDLDAQMDGEVGPFTFSRGDKIIEPSKEGMLISDLFHFDLNDKKLVGLLQKRLEEIALRDNFLLFNQVNTKLVAFLEELSFSSPFSLEYNEPQPIDYFKISNLKFEKTYESLQEKIICYVNTCIELKKCEFFIFVNLRSVLSIEELKNVYKHCRLEQIGLLLIESVTPKSLLPEEKAVIITEDLCEILEHYDEKW